MKCVEDGKVDQGKLGGSGNMSHICKNIII